MNTKIVLKLSLIGLLAFSFANMTACVTSPNRSITRVEAKNWHVKEKRSSNAACIFVIIAEFENKSGASDWILERIRTRIQQSIVGTMKFEVVERERLKAELSECRPATSGIVDDVDADVAKTGKKQTASYIIYGTVLSCRTDKEESRSEGIACSITKLEIELQVKLVNVETGRIIAAKTVASHGVDKMTVTGWGSHSTGQGMSDVIDEVGHAVADWLREVLACPAKVLKVDEAEITIDMNENEVKEDDVFDVIEEIALADPDGSAALKYEKGIGRVIITRTGLWTSQAKPVDGDKLSLEKLDIRKHTYKLRRVSPETLKKEAKKKTEKAKKEFENRF